MIYHIETEDLWQQALLAGEYVPESSREATASSTVQHWNRSRTSQTGITGTCHGLLLLCISQKLLDAETLWEPSDGLYYPHIYGPLNTSAVVAAVPFPCDDDGTFQLPANMPEDTDDLPETDL